MWTDRYAPVVVRKCSSNLEQIELNGYINSLWLAVW